MTHIQEIIAYLETKFPKDLAYAWDNVGLQIGDVNKEVKRIMVALDATTAVIDEAVQNKIDFMITHHPFFFSGIKIIDFSNPQGRNIQQLIKHDIGIYSMHTNYDVANGGMNDLLANKLKLQQIEKFAMVDEVHGLGRIGQLTHEMDLADFVTCIKNQWLVEEKPSLKIVNAHQENNLKKVAIVAGNGTKYIREAKNAGADIFVTGDVDYHTAVDAIDMGLSIVDIGHYSEIIMEKHVTKLLEEQFKALQIIRPSSAKNPILNV